MEPQIRKLLDELKEQLAEACLQNAFEQDMEHAFIEILANSPDVLDYVIEDGGRAVYVKFKPLEFIQLTINVTTEGVSFPDADKN